MRTLVTASLCVAGALLAVSVATGSAAVGDKLLTQGFSATATQSCLLHRAPVPRGSSLAVGSLSPSRRESFYPPGVVGHLTVLGIGHVDSGNLFFFRTNTLAHAGVAKLVALFVYDRGWPPLPPGLQSVIGHVNPPPKSVGAGGLHETFGNVVVIWAYPRRYKVSSERLIRACL